MPSMVSLVPPSLAGSAQVAPARDGDASPAPRPKTKAASRVVGVAADLRTERRGAIAMIQEMEDIMMRDCFPAIAGSRPRRAQRC